MTNPTTSKLPVRNTDADRRLLQVFSQIASAQIDLAKSITYRSQVCNLLLETRPIDLALFEYNHPEFGINFGYTLAVVSEDLMFEVCYLTSVLGHPPYNQATQFGLSESDIAKYQQKWRDAGVEPTEAESRE